MAKKKKPCPECGKSPVLLKSKRCRSCASKAMWQKPGFREAMSEYHRQAWARGDYGDPAQKMKDRWAEGCFDGLSDAIKAAWARGDFDSPETRQRYSETSIAAWEDPKYRENILEARRKMWQDPDYRQAQSERVKEQWASGTMDRVFKNPSSLEIELAGTLDTLGINYVQQYKLTGDGRPFDFFLPPFLLIEVDGKYWHSRPGKARRDELKTELARERGFTLLRIPERAFDELGSLRIVEEQVIPLLNETNSLLENPGNRGMDN